MRTNIIKMFNQQSTKKKKVTHQIISVTSCLILTSCSYFPSGQIKGKTPNNAKLLPIPVEKTNLPLTISATGTFKNNQITAYVPQAVIAEIKPGGDVMILPEKKLAKPAQILGQVQHISAKSTVINNISSVAVAIIPTEKATSQLQNDQSVAVDFIVGELTNVLVVPNIAITQKNNTQGVLVGAPNQPPRFVAVTTGETTGDRTEIKSGLNGTEHILIEASQLPPHLRKEGKRNNPQPKTN
jgi:hypothetical protein